MQGKETAEQLGLMLRDGWVSRSAADPSTTGHTDDPADDRAPCRSRCLCRLRPEQVFGLRATTDDGHVIGLRGMVALGEQLWRERADAGDLPSSAGSSIRGYVSNAGLIAEAM